MSEIRETDAPPAGEHIHMPAPSVIPFVNAVALSTMIVGITASLVLVILGGAVFLATTIKWIVDTKRDIEQLPAEHH